MADIPTTNKSTVEEEPMLGPGHRGLLSPSWCKLGIPTTVNASERVSTPNQKGFGATRSTSTIEAKWQQCSALHSGSSLARAFKTKAEETGDIPKPSKKGEPQ
ncbi:hypothetical protein J1N35_023959 [Gossypium stocksii]|uniref:Uncharacterized protein n=1 Tax=Gossypium stocksii TaxID=47602 RepID=A0A9D3VJL9_9ROSI|nr:hypothetical protein J1N35_023959 [Gossypium stocksii]